MPKNTTKFKIGFVIDDGMDQPDGVQQYILALGTYLMKKGHAVRYLSGETKRTDIKEVIPVSKNLRVRFNGNSLSTPLPASKKKIKGILDREKFDVLHVQMPYSPIMAARIVKEAPKGTKIIGTFHILPLGGLQSLGTKLLGYSLKKNLRRFDKFLSVSPPAKEYARQTFGIDSEVLPNPVDVQKFKDGKARISRPFNVVYLGRLVPRKGCMQLLKALDLLLQNNRQMDFGVDICGDGNQRNKLERFINKSKLKDRVKMHGFVSEEAKIKFLNNADLAIFPSISGESFGIVLIEAMAAGSGVVLAGNNPGYASVMHTVEECLFDPLDVMSFSEKIKEMIEDRDKFKLIHDKQQRLVKEFDIERIGEKLIKIYEAGE